MELEYVVVNQRQILLVLIVLGKILSIRVRIAKITRQCGTKGYGWINLFHCTLNDLCLANFSTQPLADANCNIVKEIETKYDSHYLFSMIVVGHGNFWCF